MAKLYDVSMPIHAAMPVYKNRRRTARLEVIRDFSKGAWETLHLYMHWYPWMLHHFVPTGEKISYNPR